MRLVITRQSQLIGVSTLLLLLVSILLSFFRQTQTGRALTLEWNSWMVIVQLGVIVTCWLWFWRAANWLDVLTTVMSCILVWGCFYLRFSGHFEFVMIRSSELLLRVGIGCVWGIVVLGSPVVGFHLWRRIVTRQNSRQGLVLFSKVWFASLILVGLAEPLILLVEPAPERLEFPSALSAPPTGELHIASIGGSTMLGFPYQPRFGIGNVIAWHIARESSNPKPVFHNLAAPGINLRQAISKLSLLKVKPHVLVVYTGHNEFYHDLEQLATWTESPFGSFDPWFNHSPTFRVFNRHLSQTRFVRSLSEHSGLLEDHIAPPSLYPRRVLEFRHQLDHVARFCDEQGIVPLWFIPAGSESGYEPNRTPGLGLSKIEAGNIVSLYRDARRLQRQQDWARAANLYQQGLQRSEKLAEFDFRLGECLFELKDYIRARTHFALALDNDGYPVRADPEFRRQIVEVAAQHDITLVNTESVLRPETEFGILDRTMFHDNVHPTLKAYFLLGTAAVKELSKRRELGIKWDSENGSSGLGIALKELGVDRDALADAYRLIGAGFGNLALLRSDDARRSAQLEEYIRWAELLRSRDIEPGENGVEGLR